MLCSPPHPKFNIWLVKKLDRKLANIIKSKITLKKTFRISRKKFERNTRKLTLQ